MTTARRFDLLPLVLTGVALYLAWLTRGVLMLIYVSALFAIVLTPAVQGIRRLRIGKWQPGTGVALLVLLVGGLAIVAGLFAFVIPPIYEDARGLAADWPRQAAALGERIRRLPYAGQFDPASLQQYADEAVGGAFGIAKRLVGGIFWLMSCLILTIYFILDGERAFRWAMSMVPGTERSRLEATLLRAQKRMSFWLLGQGALMLTLGLLSALVLGLLDVRYYSALAVFAGLANLVPIVGPVATVIVAGVVAAFDGLGKLAAVVAFYITYQQVENAVLVPRIMKYTVDLPPLAIISALSLGGALAGILGALIAVPSAALAAVLLDEYLVKKDSG
ncbi:MAG: AI-2E family transporter [Acidobacteria bacterium]|nr:AI-2E family transporter [Acidobacteriota bacterium]